MMFGGLNVQHDNSKGAQTSFDPSSYGSATISRSRLDERMIEAKGICRRFPDVEGNDFVLAMVNEIAMLRAYAASVASDLLDKHPNYAICRDCKRAHPQSLLKNPGCGFGVCPSCYAYRFSPAAGFGVK